MTKNIIYQRIHKTKMAKSSNQIISTKHTNVVPMIRNIGTKCPRCGKNKLITDAETDETFCGLCGFVIDEKISDNGPQRIFSDNPGNTMRTGDRATLTRYDQGLYTIINPANKDSAGNPLSVPMESFLRRLRVWDNQSQIKNASDKNLKYALGELLKIKEKLSLSDAVVEQAAYLYRKASERKLVRGRSISALMAASLYTACRELDTLRTINDVTNASNIRRKELVYAYRLIVRELDLKMPIVDSVSCIAKIASAVGLSEKTKRHATKILKKAKQNHMLAGKDPMGMAGSALYLAGIKTGEIMSQKTIALASGITEVTIRNRIKNLRNLEI